MSPLRSDLRVIYGTARAVALAVLFIAAAAVSVEAVAFAQADVRLIAMERAYEAEHRSCLGQPSALHGETARPSLVGRAA